MLGNNNKYTVPAEKAKIIHDLLKNRPSGPEGVDVKYRVIDEWDTEKERMVRVTSPSIPNFGYSDRQLFDLGMKSIEDVRLILRKINFDDRYVLGMKRKTYTRQCNRLWSRIKKPVEKILKSGGIGIYKVVHKSFKTSYTSYENNIGFVYASSYEESKNMADLMFGYLVDTPEKIQTIFTRFGTPDDLYRYNVKSIEKIDSKIKDAKKTIETMQKRIQKMKNMKAAISNVSHSMCNIKDDD